MILSGLQIELPSSSFAGDSLSTKSVFFVQEDSVSVMDEHGLPIVGTGVDYTKVGSQ